MVLGVKARIGTGNRRRILASAVIMTTALTPALAAMPAWAQQPAASAAATTQLRSERNFDIPAQPLTDALVAFGRQSGMQITVDGTLPRDMSAPAVRGAMISEEALTRLLAGSGLTYVVTDETTVAIERPGQQDDDGAMVLDPITVEGRADYGTAQIGTLPPAYPGGQVARGSRMGALGNRDIFDTPLSTKAYTDELIRDQQAITIVDVVENDPSVNVNLAPSSGNQFLIRGLPLFNAEFLIDGLSGLNLGAFTTTTGYERVEVIKGPDAMLSGMNMFGSSAGGSINLVPKRAGDEAITRLTASYENEAVGGFQADVGRRFGNDKAFGARLDLSHRQGDTAIDLQSWRDTAVAAGLDYQGERFRAALDLRYFDARVDAFSANYRAALGFALPGPPDASSNPKQAWEFVDERSVRGIVSAEYDVLRDLTVGLRYGRAETERETFATSLITIADPQGDFSSSAFFFPDEETADTAEASVRGDFSTGPLDHEVAFVASGTWRERSTLFEPITGTNFNSNIFDPARVPKPSRAGLQTSPPKTSETIQESFALADTVSAFDDRIQLTLGARHQTVQTKSFSATTGEKTNDNRQSEITPSLGLLIKPIETLSIYGNYVEALEAGPTAPVGTANSGEALSAIRTEQFEIGAKWDLGDVGVTAALFQITQPSALVDPTTNVFEIDGEQRNRGFELEVFGEPLEGIRLLGGYAFIDGELTKTAGGINDGNTAVGVPEHQLRMSAEWDVPGIEGLTLLGRTLYASKQFLNAGNTQSIPGWVRFDLGARYSFDAYGTPFTARLNVENVADSNYWQSTGRSFLSTGQPRTFLFSLSVDF